MTSQEKERKIKELQDKLESVKQELEILKNTPAKWQDGLVQPAKKSHYYIYHNPVYGFCASSAIASTNRKPEYAFRLAEQADLVIEKMLLMQEMLAFAHVRNEGWEPNWSVADSKYGLCLDNNTVKCLPLGAINGFLFGITVKSREVAEEMLSIFGERIKQYYNKQY